MTILDRVDEVIQLHLADHLAEIPSQKACSAAQAYVSVNGKVEVDHAWGALRFDAPSPTLLDSRFDIASVSKLFTATAALIAIDQGRFGFDTPIEHFFGALKGSGITVLHLMNHASGLPAWDKFYERYPMQWDVQTARANRARIEDDIMGKSREPAGSHYAYSDLGYMLLGWAVEHVFDQRLDDVVDQTILWPLGMDYSQYVSVFKMDHPLPGCAATEFCDTRGKPVCGFVHDENTYIQGGVAGHAGLFSIAGDLGLFGEHMLAIDRGLNGIVSRESLQFAWSPAAQGADGHHRAGWDTPSGTATSVGQGFHHPSTVGHLGFTGTSLWLDRRSQTVAVLLTNRVYPTRENTRIQPLRIQFHEAVSPSSS